MTSIDDIPEDMMTKMTSQGEDAFRAYVADKWDNPENLISVKYVGNYFLTAKSGMNVNTYNSLYLVYEIQATNPDPQQTINFYYYVCFDDIVKLQDGTLSVDLGGYRVPSPAWGGPESFMVGRYSYSGYDKLDSFVNNCIQTQIDEYEYTSTLN